MEWLFLPGLLAGAAGMAGTALGRRLHPKTLRGLYLACALTIGAGALLAGAASVSRACWIWAGEGSSGYNTSQS